jgi:non-specific serine/threonine protein kinase
VAYARASDSRWRLGHALILLSQVINRQGEAQRAVALIEEARVLFREQGDHWGLAYVAASLASLQEHQPNVARVAAQSSVQLYWELGDHRSLAAALEYLSGRDEAGEPQAHVRLLAAAHALRRSLGAPLPLGERDDVERQLSAARGALGQARFAAAWAEGAAMSLEQVVASALSAERSTARMTPAAVSPRGLGRSEALTRREREVAKLVARRYTDRQIADALTITEGTAGLHVHHILEKLGLRSRVQVGDWALAQGLIDARPD